MMLYYNNWRKLSRAPISYAYAQPYALSISLSICSAFCLASSNTRGLTFFKSDFSFFDIVSSLT